MCHPCKFGYDFFFAILELLFEVAVDVVNEVNSCNMLFMETLCIFQQFSVGDQLIVGLSTEQWPISHEITCCENYKHEQSSCNTKNDVPDKCSVNVSDRAPTYV